MNKYRKKTMATLLIAVFMISMLGAAMPVFAVAPPTDYDAHLITDGDAGSEDTIVITMPADFTLGMLESISWEAWTVSGYPAHVDIILGDDIDGNAGNIDSLTAEINQQPLGYDWNTLDQTYDVWLDTLERAVDTGIDQITTTNTVLWLTRHGAGPGDADHGTLAEWVGGTYTDVDDLGLTVSAATSVLRLEIEVDYWPARDGIGTVSEAYVKDIQVNGDSTDLLVEVFVPVVSIMVSPTSVDFGKLRFGEISVKTVTVFNVGDVEVDVTSITEGAFFFDNLVVTDLTESIAIGESDDVTLTLTVPATGSGTFSGKLVFTATPVEP